MVKKSLAVKTKSNLLIKLVLVSFLVTFYIDPTITDPINSPKMWAVILIGAWLLPKVLFKLKVDYNNISREQKIFLNLCMFFLFSMLISALNSEVKYRAFFGEVQRRNGFLTYFGLVVISASAALLVLVKDINRFYLVIGVGTTVLSSYGFAQYNNFDPINWNNPYSAVIGTLGNPNFMGAQLAILGVLCFSGIFVKEISSINKIFLLSITLFSFIIITLTNARQGLMSFAIGILFVICFMIYFKNRVAGIFGAGISFSVFIVGILGIFQIGPLTNFLYKDSVSLRGYYWRTGIKMLQEKPIFGVGLDNYGSYFNEYRDVSYPLKYGFSVSSNNAHNVPIQLFSTSGIFTGVLYLAIITLVAIVGMRSVIKSQGASKVFFLGLLAAYITFQSQAFVSIDNIGLSVWGWLLGGLIIAAASHVSVQNKNNPTDKPIPRDVYKSAGAWNSIISGITLIISLILIALLYQGEKNSLKVTESFSTVDNRIQIQSIEFAKNTLQTEYIEPSYKLSIALNLSRAGENEYAIKVISALLDSDKRNLNYLGARASLYEFSNQIEKAIDDRYVITKYNPWNGANYYQLFKNYMILEDLANAKNVVDKLNAFAESNEYAIKATQELNYDG